MPNSTRLPLLLLGFFALSPAWAAPDIRVDHATVVVEKRAGKEWCVLDSQVSGEVAVSQAALLAVIQDYVSYPKLFPRIQEVGTEIAGGQVLLSETVVVSALGIVNTNRFTLRLAKPETAGRSTRLGWTQERTDGTIDSLEGFWLLEDIGTGSPLVRITYRTKSAVPVRAPGQDVVVRMFLGGETKGVLEAVVKKALSR